MKQIKSYIGRANVRCGWKADRSFDSGEIVSNALLRFFPVYHVRSRDVAVRIAAVVEGWLMHVLRIVLALVCTIGGDFATPATLDPPSRRNR